MQAFDRVSFIIPSFNRYEMLLETIQSIHQLMYPNTEIIVINDASSDTRYQHLNLANVTVIHHLKSVGPGLSRQEGYRLCTGQYVVFIDDDDYYTNHHFLTQALATFKQFPDLSFVSFNATIFDTKTQQTINSPLNISGKLNHMAYFNEFMKTYQKPISTFTSVFKKSKLDMVDFEHMTMMNDTAIYLRALIAGDAYIHENNVGTYRVHSHNISKTISLSFLYENIDEKKNVFNKAKTFFDVKPQWMHQQMQILISYYICDTRAPFKQTIQLLNYMHQNLLIPYWTLTKLYLKALLLKVYSSLKKLNLF